MPMNIITILDLPFMIVNSWHQTTFFLSTHLKKKNSNRFDLRLSKFQIKWDNLLLKKYNCQNYRAHRENIIEW